MFAKHYSKYYDLFNQDKKYKKEIEFVYKWAENPKRVLDIGVGTGNYWKYINKDCEILGVERSKEMISISDFKNKIINLDISKIKKKCRKCLTSESLKSSMWK